MKLGPIAATLVLLPLAIANLGTGCSLNAILPFLGPGNSVANTVDIVFVNETAFDVDTIVNDAFFGTVTGNDPRPTSPIPVNCSPGASFAFSGDLVTANGTFPSPDNLVFNEGAGNQFSCGDTLEVHYFLDQGGVLRLDGTALIP